jgi:hypothetical protein
MESEIMNILDKLEELEKHICEMFSDPVKILGLFSEIKDLLHLATKVADLIDPNSEVGDLLESAASLVDGVSDIVNNDDSENKGS